MKINDLRAQIEDEIENWKRWCLSVHSIKPARYVCLLAKSVKSKNASLTQDINILDAEKFEILVNDLDTNEKIALRLNELNRIFVNNKLKRSKTKAHAASLMRVNYRTYKKYLIDAYTTLAIQLKKPSSEGL